MPRCFDFASLWHRLPASGAETRPCCGIPSKRSDDGPFPMARIVTVCRSLQMKVDGPVTHRPVLAIVSRRWPTQARQWSSFSTGVRQPRRHSKGHRGADLRNRAWPSGDGHYDWDSIGHHNDPLQRRADRWRRSRAGAVVNTRMAIRSVVTPDTAVVTLGSLATRTTQAGHQDFVGAGKSSGWHLGKPSSSYGQDGLRRRVNAASNF